jgi:hypothetical protein
MEKVWLETAWREKMISMREELHKDMMKDNIEVCCYCNTPRNGKNGCCGEVHFVTYKDMERQDQQAWIDSELQFYEDWSRQQ